MSDRIGLARCSPICPCQHCIAASPIDETIDWREAMNATLYRLTVIHRRLDEEIRRELKRRFPDNVRLLRLKKLRLAIKDRLYRIVPRRSPA